MRRRAADTRIFKLLTRGVLLLVALLAGPAYAQGWQNLAPAEREVLRQHQGNWDRYSPEQQQRLRHGAQRYLELTPSQREGVRQQQERYRSLPPEEQRQLREEYRGRRKR